MNRNAAIAVVVIGVLLAALSVGSATYMSAGTIEQKTQAMKSDLTTQLGSKIDKVAADALPKANGEASSLSSTGFLWSKGRLTVTDVADANTALFEVDPATSRVVIAADKIDIGDVVTGKLRSTGAVSADGFQTSGDAWAVDASGDQRSDGDLTVGGDVVTGGILKVNGGELRVGDGFVYDASAKQLSVVGEIVASKFNSGNVSTELVSDVQFDKDAFSALDTWRISQDGTARFGGTTLGMLTTIGSANVGGPLDVTGTLTAVDIAATGNATVAGTLDVTGKLTASDVAATGNATVAGTLDVTGKLTASDVAASGNVDVATLSFGGTPFNPATGVDIATDVAGRDLIAHRTFKTAGDTFTVQAATGNTTVGGTLAVTGLFTADDISAGGNVDVASLSFGGVAFDPGTGKTGTKDVLGRDIIASRTLKTEGNLFTVQAATGNTTVGGTLTVTGLLTADDIVAGGNVDVTSLSFGGVAFAGDVGSNSAKDVIGRDLIAHRTLKTSGDHFTVEASTGDTTVDGKLTVGGAISAASLSTTGNVHVGNNLTADGYVHASNLPTGMASGTRSAAVGSNSVSVAGMPAGASVVVTPQGATTGPYYVTPAAGEFTLFSSDAVDFSWIAAW